MLEVTATCGFDQAQEAKAHEYAVLELTAQKYAIEIAMERREYQIKDDVASEKNGEEKPRYSNADMRKAEELRRAETDKQLAELRSQLAETNRELGEHQVEAKHCSRNIRIICAFAGLVDQDPFADHEE